MSKVIFLNSCFLLVFLLINSISFAEDYKKWIMSLKVEALEYGISEKTFISVLDNLEAPNKKVIKFYNNQPEFKITFDKYYNRNINNNKVSSGKNLLNKHKKLLKELEKKYSIPSEIIISIWGIETNYGSYIGNFNVIDALATLAYLSRRKEFFKRELYNSLVIVEKKYIQAKSMIGSWAGAMGQGQFMPSSFLEYAVDYNKDNKIDLWHSYEDIFASIANYLNLHGWDKNYYWSGEIINNKTKININSNKKYISSELKTLFSNEMVLKYFKNNEPVLIKTMGKDKSSRYFLISKNFKTLKKYNNSDFYALVVGDLANKIKEN